jgi:hypothetical protein
VLLPPLEEGHVAAYQRAAPEYAERRFTWANTPLTRGGTR